MKLEQNLRVRPGSKVRLDSIDPDSTAGIRDKDRGKQLLEESVERLNELQFDLYAENRRSLLIVLQAMDAGGKDGVIRALAPGLNPQGCHVTSFKVPSSDEAAHDFLWRIHRAVPGKGDIGIFNRSHYEDVLVVRVRKLVPEEEWTARYDQINAFEDHLHQNGVTVLKFFLHISKAEQKRRLQERLDDPRKRWKFSTGDLEERKRWSDYQKAYEALLARCSTKAAPWYVIPANKNWYRNAAIARIVVETLEEMKPKVPESKLDLSKVRIP